MPRTLTAVLIAVGLVLATMQATSGWIGVVTTRGISMEPTFSQDDLVVTRRTGSYEVGDVISYRSAQLGDEVVLHRIIDVRGGRHITQGDNNDWVDTDRPSLDDIVGEVWFDVPQAGRLAAPLRRAGPVVAVGAFLLISFAFTTRSRPQDDSRRTRSVSRSIRSHLLAPSVTTWLLVVLAASALLAVTSFRMPVISTGPAAADVRHDGTFSYEADVERSVIYPDGSIDPGDPVFRSVTDHLAVRYDHVVRGPAGSPVDSGQVAGDIVLRIGAWEHQLESLPPTELRDGRASLAGAIDMDAAQSVIDRYRAVSGATAVQAVVTVEPFVTTRVDEQSIAEVDEFETALTITWTPDELGIAQDGLHVSGVNEVEVLVDAPHHLDLLGREIAVSDARRLGAGAALGAAALLLAAAVLRRRPGFESAPIVAAAGNRLVAVGSLDHLRDTVAVLDPHAFGRIAGASEAMVLRAVADDGAETFVVDDGRSRYRYATAQQARPTAVGAGGADVGA